MAGFAAVSSETVSAGSSASAGAGVAASGSGAGVSNSDPPDVAGSAAAGSGAGVSNSELPESAGVSKSDDPPDALAAGPASAVSVTVSSVTVTSPASGSSLVATSVAAAAAGAAVEDGAVEDGAALVACSPFTDARSICATSRTSTSSRASPLACWAVRPSESITRQKGQPTAIWSAPVPTASLVRLTLIRSPRFSSIHMRAPPAPQQKERSELRSISTYSAPGSTCSSSRGGE